ncbi:MAG: Ppx/GppA family phosphatase [Synergistetes bacterium]|nr:Ppx/GppA family phosphatase [Synergistota bacterium]
MQLSRYATVDVGSNSALMYIADRLQDKTFKRVGDVLSVTKLGRGVYTTGLISSEAMDRTVGVLKSFAGLMEDKGVVGYAAIGTMALRMARNAEDFLKRVKQETGIELEIIDGHEEAKLSYIGAVSGFDVRDSCVVVFDIGGGSTEIVYGKGYDVRSMVSLNVGALTLSERYLLSNPATQKELDELLSFADVQFSRVNFPDRVRLVIGVGGNVTTMASVKLGLCRYDPDRVHGVKLAVNDVIYQMKLYLSMSVEERRHIVGLEPERADIILGGAAILYSLLKSLRIDSFFVSDRGLRHGLMIERFGKS